MSSITDKMRKPANGPEVRHGTSTGTPKKGELFRCPKCGMEIQITADCKCDEPDHVHFKCCGEEMQQA